MNDMNDKFTSLNYRYMDDSIYNRHTSPPSDFNHSYDDMHWKYNNRDDIFTADSRNEGYSVEERALVRKIDFLILPIICTLDFLQVTHKIPNTNSMTRV